MVDEALKAPLMRLLAPRIGHRAGRWPAAVGRIIESAAAERRVQPEELLALLMIEPDESIIRRLIAEVTVGYTKLFRHPAHFERFAAEVQRMARPARVWCAGCSTGAEPRSIEAAAREAGATVSVWATDVDADAIDEARAKEEGRDTGITYEVASLIGLRPLGRPSFDYVFCRNVLIYFPRERATEVLRTLRTYARRAVVVAPTDLLVGLPAGLVPADPPGWLEVGPVRMSRPPPRPEARPSTPPDGSSRRIAREAPPVLEIPPTLLERADIRDEGVRAASLLVDGRHALAEDTVRRRLSREPENPTLWFVYGETLLARGQARQARVAFVQAHRHARHAELADPETLSAAALRRANAIDDAS